MELPAEIPEREKPGEIVLLGRHLDSWDVEQCAQDDGAGIVASMEAMAIIHKLGLQPRRRVLVVAFTDEEISTRGGPGYPDWAADT